jgi:hypothetical protein
MKLSIELMADLGGLLVCIHSQFIKKGLAHRFKPEFGLLDFLVEGTNMSEKFIGLGWDEVKFMQKLIV